MEQQSHTVSSQGNPPTSGHNRETSIGADTSENDSYCVSGQDHQTSQRSNDNASSNQPPVTPQQSDAIINKDEDDDANVFDDDVGLLSKKRKSRRAKFMAGYHHYDGEDDAYTRYNRSIEWQRPYWLGSTLFLILFAFWLLDSLKDPLFARLVDGQISRHQPPAKLVSVGCTLLLVCVIEYIQNLRQEHQRQQAAVWEESSNVIPHDEVLNPGGTWYRMPMMIGRSIFGYRRGRRSVVDDNDRSSSATKRWSILNNNNNNVPTRPPPSHALDDTVSVRMFYQIGAPYIIAFAIIGYLVWKFEQSQILEQRAERLVENSSSTSTGEGENSPVPWDWWYVLGYALYATVESFGSLAVATFWSYTNSTLSLDDAERYYGPVIATAQLGAIAGSTLVAAGRWDPPILLSVVAMTIALQLVVIQLYDRKFIPTSILASVSKPIITTTPNADANRDYSNRGSVAASIDDARSVLTWQDNNATITKPFWSGLYLILRHSYVLLILGVSCLYEVSMTLLDYQMKLLGYERFDNGDNHATSTIGGDTTITTSAESSSASMTMSFSKFMGRYGQVVNFISLIFSSILFPWLIRQFGLRRTLMIFPTLLLLVTFVAYGALPGNLTVLFFSLSLLKAMTYSVHDPSKELLYIPTSNAVKFRAKFWIDVVGERISKAIGSSFNTLADSVEESIRIGAVPSLLSSLGLWLVCYYVGKRFDKLLATGKIVGLEHGIDPSSYTRVSQTDDGKYAFDMSSERRWNNRHDDHDDDGHDEPSEVEVLFEEQSHVSTLDLMADPTTDAINNRSQQRPGELFSGRDGLIELPPVVRL